MWLALIACASGPAAVAWYVIRRAEATVTLPPPLVWVPATASAPSTTLPTALVPTWSRPPATVAPAWTGLVQRVLVEPGDEIAPGSQIALVDGVLRVGARTDVPISRTLQRGDRGLDVSALNSLLMSLGLPVSPDDTFGATTAASVREFAKGLGAGDTEVFDPAWLVYLPYTEAESVSSVSLEVAQPVPPAGSTIVTVEPHLVNARVVPPESMVTGDQLGSGAPADDPSGSASTPDEPSFDPGLAYTDLPANTVLTVEGTDIGRVGPDGALPQDTLAALAAILSPANDVTAELRQPSPTGATQVPTASLITGAGAKFCVLARRADQLAAVAAVDVLDSYLGVSILTGLAAGDEVLVNPSLEDRRACR